MTDVAIVSGNNTEVTQGQLIWADGENGDKTLSAIIKAYSGWEIEKTFLIEIFDVQNDVNAVDNGEVDPDAGSITVIISKRGDPNGILQLSEESRTSQQFVEPEIGDQMVSFYVERRGGNLGDQVISWTVTAPEQIDGDLDEMSGTVLMKSGVSVVPIILSILADDIPETTEYFTLTLSDVMGGASIQPNVSYSNFSILYNDDPHGVFQVLDDEQRVTVDMTTLQRTVELSVNRTAGTFGPVRVTLRVSFNQPEPTFPVDKDIIFIDGQVYSAASIDLIGEIFVKPESRFTVMITDVTYVGEDSMMSPPRIGAQDEATIKIPEETINSVVGFAFHITLVDEETRVANLTLTRTGLYGNLQLPWKTGYLDDQTPSGFTAGTINPSTGSIFMQHGEREASVPVTLTSWSVSAEQLYLYRVYLSESPVTSVPGGARLASQELTFTNIEPSGILRFSTPTVMATEEQTAVTLTVVRDYGTQGNIQVRYSSYALSASSGKDFTAVENQPIIMNHQQREVEIVIPIALDSLAEKDESFTVVLESAELLPTSLSSLSPRISSLTPNCTVIIKANGDPNGLMDIVIDQSRVEEGEFIQVRCLNVLHPRHPSLSTYTSSNQTSCILKSLLVTSTLIIILLLVYLPKDKSLV